MPKLTDFDLVRAKDTTGGTRTGAMGTFLFTAPEQMNDAKEADARADVYGLGMTALFCLHGEELPAIVMRRPEEVVETLPCSEAVKAVLARAIELEPERRYADARAFSEALRAALTAPAPPALFAKSVGKLPFPRARAAVAVLSVAILASSIGMSVWLNREMNRRSAATADAGAAASVSVVAPPPTPCPEGMVPIKAGAFTMGSAEAEGTGYEKPPHKVTLSAFCLDKTEVTVAAYRERTKVDRYGVQCHVAPSTARWGNVDVSRFCNADKVDKDTHPVNCVDWDMADVYCKWTGGALPTEAQWEYAARGLGGRTYPWGEEAPGPRLLNSCGTECRPVLTRLHPEWKLEVMYDASDGAEATAPVGKYPEGASQSGALDMAGNVMEWVADWHAPYPDSPIPVVDPKGPDKGIRENRRVLRGGAWQSSQPSWVRTTFRVPSEPSARSPFIGFRCARGQDPGSAPPEPSPP
jgi:formylglycine-generating enzyme required for sulfatase activity